MKHTFVFVGVIPHNYIRSNESFCETGVSICAPSRWAQNAPDWQMGKLRRQYSTGYLVLHCPLGRKREKSSGLDSAIGLRLHPPYCYAKFMLFDLAWQYWMTSLLYRLFTPKGIVVVVVVVVVVLLTPHALGNPLKLTEFQPLPNIAP